MAVSVASDGEIVYGLGEPINYGQYHQLALATPPIGKKQVKAPVLARLFHALATPQLQGTFEFGGFSEGVTYGATTELHSIRGRFEFYYESEVFPSHYMSARVPSSMSWGIPETDDAEQDYREHYYEQQFRDMATPSLTQERLEIWKDRHSDNQTGIFFYFDGGVFRMMSGIEHIAHHFSPAQQKILQPQFPYTFRVHEIASADIPFTRLFSHATQWAEREIDFTCSSVREELELIRHISPEQDACLDKRSALWWHQYSSSGCFD